MRVQDILHAKNDDRIISAHSNEPIPAALQRLHENGIGVLVVLNEDGQVAGILSERDIVRGLAQQGARALDRRVEDLMSRPIHTCKPTDEIRDVMARMTNFRIRHLPVVDEGRLRGMVSIGDVVKHRLTEMETETNVLRDIILAR
jgi:CBS domain-containing protein